jgi:hypothetical protein
MARRTQLTVVAVVAAAGVIWLWQGRASPQEKQIRRRVADFTAEFNAAAPDGVRAAARAARLGQFFTSDAVVELGRGATAIHGRDTLMGMAARLQPRTADVSIELTDVNVEIVDEARAEITLTAVMRRRRAGDESLDAREFVAEVQYIDGDWRASRVAAVDTFR